MVALVDGLPRTLTLREFLSNFLSFRYHRLLCTISIRCPPVHVTSLFHRRCEVIERRTQFELAKASKRLHLVDGLITAMSNIDATVKIIREAKDGASAAANLQQSFSLTKEQAEGVLALTLRRLTSLESGKLAEEQATLQARYVNNAVLQFFIRCLLACVPITVFFWSAVSRTWKIFCKRETGC